MPCVAASCAMPRPIWPAPTTPSSLDRPASRSDELDGQRDAFAAADAQRGDAAPLAGVAQRREQRDQHARAAGADRVARARPRRPRR